MLALLKQIRYIFILPFILISFSNAFGNSQGEAVILHKFKSWAVYQGPNNIYFMGTKAQKQSGTYSKREEPFLMVTLFPDRLSPEVSVYIGYTCRSGVPVDASIDMSYTDTSNVKGFTMHSVGERAWLKGDEDSQIIDLFQKGAKVRINAESHKSTKSTDIYSLDGFEDAYKALLEAKKNKK